MVGEAWHAELMGGGFGRGITVSKTKPIELPKNTSRSYYIPTVNILEKPSVIWGRSAESIAGDFKKAGYTVNIRGSNRANNKSQIIEIKGHKQIQQIQISPEGGRHGGGYYKISTSNKGIIKVVDKATYKPTEKEKAKIIYK